MHKKSPAGGEDTLYIPFKFYRKAPCVSNKKPSCHGIMKEIFESFSDRRFPMPYINIKITREGTTAEQKAELIKGATELLARVLNKNPKTTVVTIEEVDTDSWGIGGDPVEIAREKGEAQDAKIARLEADKEEQEKELENLKKLLLQDGKKEDIPPLPEEETTEETPVFTLNNNALKLKNVSIQTSISAHLRNLPTVISF